MPVPFDTHAFILDMTQAGMPDAQAEALSHQLQDIYSTNAVTKQDLELAVAHLDTRFAAVDTRFAMLDSQLEKRFATIDVRFATIEGQMTHLRYLGYAIFAATVVKFFVN